MAHNEYFHIVVKKMINYRGKLITNKLVKKWLQNMLDEDYNDAKMYKTIHKLKNKGEILPIKKNMFIAKAPNKEFEEDEIIEKYYREVLKKHCKEFVQTRRYIGGLKALELNTSNYIINDNILVITINKSTTETIMMDKKIVCKMYQSKQKNLFQVFYKHSKKIKIGKHRLPIACIEIALLESLYNTSILHKKYTEELVKKVIRKQKKTLDISIFETVLKHNKHHSSINRFYQLARSIDEEFAQKINTIIKRYSYLMTSKA